MGTKPTQISAAISDTTRERLERMTRERGVKKGWLIEHALLHYLHALDQLPTDVIIPPRIIVDRETGERIFQRVEQPAEPTDAMRDLFAE